VKFKSLKGVSVSAFLVCKERFRRKRLTSNWMNPRGDPRGVFQGKKLDEIVSKGPS